MLTIAAGLLALQTVVTPWPLCSNRLGAPKSDSLADTLARRLAPVLSFAPGERFFPTLPFFTALDGDSALGDPDKADFEDPYEVAPYLMDSTGKTLDTAHVSWRTLVDTYLPKPEARSTADADHHSAEYALKRVVVLYRICALSPEQNRTVVRYLKSDEQAFDRFEMARPLRELLGPEPAFEVIQYYLYYLADWGLQGHPNDIELVSVFFPSREYGDSAYQTFRIIVGSGHTPRTPNNVLVLSAYHRGEKRLEDSAHVLVELGGHSSAPDVRPIGRFTPGLDANWHAYDVWGTRDAQAASGVGYLGRYQQAMTFDRGWQSDGILVFPPNYDTVAMRRAQEAIQGPPDSTKPTPKPIVKQREQRNDPAQHQYRLLPVRLLAQVDTALALDPAVPFATAIAQPGALDAISRAVDTLERRLCPRRLHGGGGCDGEDSLTWWHPRLFSQLPVETRIRAIQAMRLWKQDMIIGETFTRFESRDQALPGLPRVVEELSRTKPSTRIATTQRPWEHESFMGKCAHGKECEGKGNPAEVLKAHLFRPNTYTTALDGGITNLILWGVRMAPVDGYELYTGMVVPAFRSHGLPIRLGGFLELQAGVTCGWRCRAMSPSFSVLQGSHWNAMLSWYVTGSWVPRRAEVTQTPDAGEFSIGGGVSLLPSISPNTFQFINIVRIRAGLRFDPLRGKDLLNRARWELNFAFRQ